MVTVERDSLEQLLALLPPSPDDDTLVSSSTVKKEHGDICTMTLWRWLHPGRSKKSQEHTPEESAKIPFPPPDLVINRRRYWKRRTLRQHRYRLEMQKPQPVKAAVSFVQSPRQTRSTHPARIPQEERGTK
jgi:hypothetical protein